LIAAARHRAKGVRWPARVVPVSLPAYCPELEPHRALVAATQGGGGPNTLFGALEPLRACLDPELRAWTNAPQRLRSLTGYPYILDALNSLA
jgi:hypothetical protein